MSLLALGAKCRDRRADAFFGSEQPHQRRHAHPHRAHSDLGAVAQALFGAEVLRPPRLSLRVLRYTPRGPGLAWGGPSRQPLTIGFHPKCLAKNACVRSSASLAAASL